MEEINLKDIIDIFGNGIKRINDGSKLYKDLMTIFGEKETKEDKEFFEILGFLYGMYEEKQKQIERQNMPNF